MCAFTTASPRICRAVTSRANGYARAAPRITAVTYRKNVKDAWPQDEFTPTEVVNPAWRTLDKAVKKTQRGLRKLQAQLGALCEDGDADTHLHKKEEEARALVRERLVSATDIDPDTTANTVTVRIHRMACPAHDKAIAALLDALTQMEFSHPEIGPKMVYTLA